MQSTSSILIGRCCFKQQLLSWIKEKQWTVNKEIRDITSFFCMQNPEWIRQRDIYSSPYGTYAFLNAVTKRDLKQNTPDHKVTDTVSCESHKTSCSRGQLKCDGTRAETRFRLSAKRTSSFKSPGSSVQSTTDSRGVRISGSNAGCTMFRGSVKGTGYPLHSPVSPSRPLPCVTVCHHSSTGVYLPNAHVFQVS